MENREIQVVKFMEQSGNYIDYQNINIAEVEKKLENENLSPMERRRLESIYKNCMLLQQNSFNEKTNFLSEETRSVLRQRRITEMKKEKEKTLKWRKIKVYVGCALTIAGITTGVGCKVHRDHEIKKAQIQIVRENHAVQFYTVEQGDTIDAIAKKFYNESMEEAKNIISFENFKKSIIEANHIQDPNDIKIGSQLLITTYDDKKELDNKTEKKEYECTETFHIIQFGDTVDGISWDIYNSLPNNIQESVTMQSIKNKIIDWNNLDNPNNLRNGEELTIPCYQYINDLTEENYHVK